MVFPFSVIMKCLLVCFACFAALCIYQHTALHGFQDSALQDNEKSIFFDDVTRKMLVWNMLSWENDCDMPVVFPILIWIRDGPDLYSWFCKIFFLEPTIWFLLFELFLKSWYSLLLVQCCKPIYFRYIISLPNQFYFILQTIGFSLLTWYLCSFWAFVAK